MPATSLTAASEEADMKLSIQAGLASAQKAFVPRVWAPKAREVHILIGDLRRPMQRDQRGWWSDSGPGLAPLTDYWFMVDGEGPFPDPRSQWQPSGPHQPSRIVDHQSFEWTDTRWQPRPLSAALIYEIHIATFTPEGTFDTAVDKLDHLVALGVTHVEIMPVAEFQGRYGWGYDGVSLYAPQHSYGGPDGLKRFVNACHAKGLAVVLDVVYNHLGPSGNYLPRFGPYFSERHQTPWGSALNYDGPYSHEVRRFVIENALMWLSDYHIDGLRLDAVHSIIDLSATHVLEELAVEVESLEAQLGRHFVLIAESDLNDPRIVRPREIGGFGLGAQWCDDIHHAVHSVLTGERQGYYADFGTMEDLAAALKQPYVYAGRYSEVRGRVHGRAPEGLSGSRFIAFLQNHDQLGNRARGDRISHLIDLDRTKIGAALILLSPYVPMLFQGEEWAASSPFQYFVDFNDDPELAAAVRKGRIQEFGSFGWSAGDVPDPTEESTYVNSRLKWDEIERPAHAEILEWHRALIRLRRELPALASGRLDRVDVRFDSQRSWLVLERDNVSVLCNLSAARQTIPLQSEGRTVLLASKDDVRLEHDEIILPGQCVVVLGRREAHGRNQCQSSE